MSLDLTITSLETITAFGLNGGSHLFTMDELQNATIANTQEKVDITGKGGRKLNSLKRNKAVTISGTNGMLSTGLMEMQTGGKFEAKEAAEVMWADYLTVGADHAVTLSYAAEGTTGAEIVDLIVKNADGSEGAHLEQVASTVVAGKFTYTSSSKKLQMHTDIAENTEIVVYYKRTVNGSAMDNESDVYSQKCQLFVDAIGEDKCSKVYHVQFYIPKADFNGEFSIEMGDNQTVHAFEAESLSGACGAGGALWTCIVFGVDEAAA